MIAEKWEQIKELFESALDCSPERRKSLLAQLRQDDPAAADELERLLASYEKAGDFLLQPCCVAYDLLEDLEVEEQRFSPGDVLCGRFRIVHLIGRGGMGEVYQAWDEELEDHVALKVLRLEISTHELFTSRFRREIQLARKVTHANVCRIFDSFKHPVGDGTYISVLSMELLQGQTLADYLKAKGRLSAAESLPIARQIVAGLSAIHAAGIVHRDLKPSNLVLVPEGTAARTNITKGIPVSGGLGETEGVDRPDQGNGAADRAGDGKETFLLKITDFGIAGRLPDGLSPAAQTEVSKLMGTPDYMAPEQLEHARASVKSDIYSLGLVLYEMVTGVKPFAGASAWKRTTADPPTPRKLAPALPDNWNKTIACCLERNPQYRFQSTQAVLDSLSGDASATKIPAKPLFVRLKRATKRKVGVIAIFFLLAMSLAAGAYRYYNQRPGVPNGTMVLLTNLQTNNAGPYFVGITLALKKQLERSARFEVVRGTDNVIEKVLKRMQLNADEMSKYDIGRKVALESGSSLVIFGNVTKNQNEYLLTLILERVKFTSLFPMARWEQTFRGSDDKELLQAVQLAANWIRDRAGESASDPKYKNPPPGFATNSWDAWRLLNEANAVIAQDDYDSAESLLRSALEKDPDFPSAHMRLADILISMRHDNEGLIEWENTLGALKKHVQDIELVGDRENLRILGQYYEDTGDYSSAQKVFYRLTSLYPSDYLGWFYLGSTLDKGGLEAEAQQAFAQAVSLYPESVAAHAHLGMLYIKSKDFSRADMEIAAVEKTGASDWASWLRVISAFVRNDFDGALAYATELGASPQPTFRSTAYAIHANLLADLGRRREAIAVLKDGAAFDRDNKLVAEERDKLIGLAYLHYRLKAFDKCREFALRAVTLDPNTRHPFALGPRHRMEAGTLFARCGDLGNANEQLSALHQQQLTQTNAPLVQAAVARLEGELALAGHRPNEAALTFAEAVRIAPAGDDQSYFAEALIGFVSQSEAAKILKSMADDPGHNLMYRDHDFPGLWADSLERLALAQDAATACPYAKEYLKLRNHADSDMQPALSMLKDRINAACLADNLKN